MGRRGRGSTRVLIFPKNKSSRWRGPLTVGWSGAAGKTFLLPLSLFATIFLSFIDINYQIFPPASCPQHTCKKWENIPNMRTWFFCLLQNPINRVSHQIYAIKYPLCQKQRKGQLSAGKKGKVVFLEQLQSCISFKFVPRKSGFWRKEGEAPWALHTLHTLHTSLFSPCHHIFHPSLISESTPPSSTSPYSM